MALQNDPPHLGDIGDSSYEPCDFAGTLHSDGCECGAIDREDG